MNYKTRMQVKTAMAPDRRTTAEPEFKRVIVPFSVKADAVDTAGRTFTGLSAVWELDLGNDIIQKGAFAQTLKDWKKSGEALPLLNSHNHYDIFAALGQCLEATETKDGLLTTWEVIDGPDGDAVLTRLRPSKRTGKAIIGKMSIGYEPVKWSYEQPDGSDNPWDRIRHLEQLNWKETSLVLFPMAPNASIDCDSVKSFLVSAKITDPRSVSPETKEELRRLSSRIGILLSGKKTDEDKTGDTPPAADPVNDPAPPTGALDPTDLPEVPKTEVIVDPPEPEVVEEEKTEPVQSVYVFDEALKHRLSKVLLKNRMSDLGVGV